MARNRRHAALCYCHCTVLHRIILLPHHKTSVDNQSRFRVYDSHLSLSLTLNNKNKMSSSDNLLPQNSRIVQPAFLEQHSNKVRLVSWIDYRLLPSVEVECSSLCRVISCCILLACCGSLTLTLLHTRIFSHYLFCSLMYCNLQKDLVKRLRALNKVLEHDPDLAVDSTEWPGLNATASLLVTDEYLQHADKEVRLYTVQACMELFAIVSNI